MEIELTNEMVKGIRRCRHELRLSQEEFGTRYETTGATICRLESGNQGRIKKKLWELFTRTIWNRRGRQWGRWGKQKTRIGNLFKVTQCGLFRQYHQTTGSMVQAI